MNIYPANIHRMMTGGRMVKRRGDTVTLEYEDGAEESATIPPERWRDIRDNWFSIVSEVQSIARRTSQEKNQFPIDESNMTD